MSIQENYQKVQDIIEQACIRGNRDKNDVKVVAVTKYVDIEKTKTVIDLGIAHIGENVVQNAIPKYEALSAKVNWHFIGRLQTNKVKYIIDKFQYIHSVDRLSLAEEINKRAKSLGIKTKCFIQVNISGEDTKTGVSPMEVFDFVTQISAFDSIEVVGLMTMAPFEASREEIRSIFRSLRELKDQINEKELMKRPLTELSMGMSNDFEIAVEEGATFLRLGTILVGKNEKGMGEQA